jgi:hypothetical protein
MNENNTLVNRIIDLLQEISDKLDEQHEEILEAVSNLSPGGRGYQLFDADEEN